MNTRAEAAANILVVDDEASIVRLFVRTLASAGYTNVRGITDAREVPAFLDASTPDLVILDLNMPGLDGFALLREISDRLTEDVFLPVLAVSGMATPEAKQRAFQSGAKDFLAKPVDLHEFLLHINSLLETRFLSVRLRQTQERLADLVGLRTEELQESVARTQKAEEALRLSEEQFRQLAESAGVGVTLFSLDGTVLFANDAAASLEGLTAEQAVGRSAKDYLGPAQFEELLKILDSVSTTGEVLQAEHEMVLPGGWSGWLLSTYTRVTDSESNIRGVQVISSNITERKIAEQELRESEERFNKAFHSNPALSTIAGSDDRLIDANEAWLNALGYSRDEVVGRTTVELGVLTADDRALLVAAANDPKARGGVEVTVKTTAGDSRTLLSSVEFVDIKGERCLLSSSIDITERKAIEESLLLTQFCVDHAAESIIWFGADGKVQYANEYCTNLYGYTRDEFANLTIFDLDEDVTPQSWRQEWEAMKEHGAITLSRRPQKKNGERFFGEITSTYLRHGSAEQVMAFLRDVTAGHTAEEALKASEDRLSHMFESMSSGVVVYETADGGTDFLIKEMNRAAERITGVTADACKGMRVLEVFPGVQNLGLYEVFERVWRTGASESLPAGFYEDGRLTLWVENFVYRLPSGEVVAIFDDVTEKQQAFAKLREANLRLRNAQTGTLRALGAVTEFRDPYTAGHQQKVAKIAELIGSKMGLTRSQLDGLRAAAVVHDVGKIAVPTEILSSPGHLNPAQQMLVR
ncbi:MAG: PAS domain S-box protein, partial [Actinobacteria bacterium]|nr:PAS domain S-box protein [Actinomycetota bacterium]